jgi:DNA-binding transcriptional ArsR family regulator
MPVESDIARMATLFGLLSNETRIKLLLALKPGLHNPRRELCVCDLATVAKASQSMTSHQLGLLRGAQLVESRREGKLVLYRLVDGPTEHLLIDALEHIGIVFSTERVVSNR